MNAFDDITSKWRPPEEIKSKVIGLITRGSEILVCAVYNDEKQIIGYRPPGGGINFAESRHAAISRELEEELGIDAKRIGRWHTIENIFEHEGSIGHEFIYVSKVSIENGVNARESTTKIFEDSGRTSLAEWANISDILMGRKTILPSGLKELIQTI